jgi:hypothetical protein
MFQDTILPTAAVDIPQTLPRTGSLRVLGRLPQWIPLPRSGREYLVWTGVLMLITGLVALQIWLSLRIAQTQQTLNALQVEYRLVEQENAELLWQISQYTSLDRIKIEAERMGYGPTFQREYRWSQPGYHLTQISPGKGTPEVTIGALPREMIGDGAGVAWHQSLWLALAEWWELRRASTYSARLQ